MRRVVVTGIGAVTPVGTTARETWDAFVHGRSGIAPISLFDSTDFDVRIAGEVKGFTTDGVIIPKEARHMDRSVQMALVATREAVDRRRLEISEEEAPNVGVIYGTGAGGFGQLLAQQQVIDERGPSRVSPFFIPHFLRHIIRHDRHPVRRPGAQYGRRYQPVRRVVQPSVKLWRRFVVVTAR